MFSIDDEEDLDITEQDFLKAALQFESQASSADQTTTKRKSFELKESSAQSTTLSKHTTSSFKSTSTVEPSSTKESTIDAEIAQTLDAFASDFEDSPEIPLIGTALRSFAGNRAICAEHAGVTSAARNSLDAKNINFTKVVNGPVVGTASRPAFNAEGMNRSESSCHTKVPKVAKEATDGSLSLSDYQAIFSSELDSDLELSFATDPFDTAESETDARTPKFSANGNERELRAGPSMTNAYSDRVLGVHSNSQRPFVTKRDSNLPKAASPSSMSRPVSPAPPAERTGHHTPATSSNRSMKRKRKFPGPAGALPKLKPGNSLEEASFIQADSPCVPRISIKCSELTSSQSSEDYFTGIPWTRMMADLEPQARGIIQQFGVTSVLIKASRRQLPRGKVPVICVVIESLEVHSADASVVLRDPSGHMKGTIHRQLMKEYPTQLQCGSVLVLRQVGVFSPSTRNHYLNITPNNLIRIYSREAEGQVLKHNVAEFVEDDFVIPEPVPQPQTPVADPPSFRGNNTNAPGETSAAWSPFQPPGLRTAGTSQIGSPASGTFQNNHRAPWSTNHVRQPMVQNRPHNHYQNSPRNTLYSQHNRYPAPRFHSTNQIPATFQAANLMRASFSSPHQPMRHVSSRTASMSTNQTPLRGPSTNQISGQTHSSTNSPSNIPLPRLNQSPAPQALKPQDSNRMGPNTNDKKFSFKVHQSTSPPLIPKTAPTVQCSNAELWQDDGLDAMLNDLDDDMLKTDF